MDRRVSRFLSACIPAVAGLACVVGAATDARAQVVMAVESSVSLGGAGGSADSMISRPEAERYGKLLGLSPEQMEGMLALHDGYQTAIRAARKAQRDAIGEMMRTAEETGDHTIWSEKMPALRKTLVETSEKLEREFFGDMRTISGVESSDPRWASVERARRRVTTLRGGLVGEDVDLIRIVDGMSLSAEVRTALAEPLLAYEIELDRALQHKQKEQAKVAAEPISGMINAETMNERLKTVKEAGKQVRDVNDSFARRISSALPEDHRKDFDEAVRRQMFPRIYRESRIEQDLVAALKLDDLDAAQKDDLRNLLESYRRDAAPLNRAWADAIVEAEKSEKGGSIVGPGGESISVRMGEEPEGLKNARAARRELDESVRERLQSRLRPEQREKLPKPPAVRQIGGEAIEIQGAEVLMIGN